MLDLDVLDDPAAAAVVMDPIKSRLQAEPNVPGSAASLAPRVGLTRQKVNYHLRALEEHKLVKPVEERHWGGLTERLMVATARSYVVSPSALGRIGADPARAPDRGCLLSGAAGSEILKGRDDADQERWMRQTRAAASAPKWRDWLKRDST